jgi:hypothetical protein
MHFTGLHNPLFQILDGHPSCSTYGRHNSSDGVAKAFTVSQFLAIHFDEGLL